jgi:hypothetical protein
MQSEEEDFGGGELGCEEPEEDEEEEEEEEKRSIASMGSFCCSIEEVASCLGDGRLFVCLSVFRVCRGWREQERALELEARHRSPFSTRAQYEPVRIHIRTHVRM